MFKGKITLFSMERQLGPVSSKVCTKHPRWWKWRTTPFPRGGITIFNQLTFYSYVWSIWKRSYICTTNAIKLKSFWKHILNFAFFFRMKDNPSKMRKAFLVAAEKFLECELPNMAVISLQNSGEKELVAHLYEKTNQVNVSL